MMKVLKGLPGNVLGVEASGRVTREDYEKVLIPAVQRKLSDGEKLRMIYCMDADAVFDFGAIQEDMSFGFGHWRDFSHIALVTDNIAVRSMTLMFMPFFPGKIRTFPAAELAEAKDWIKREDAGNDNTRDQEAA